MKLMVLAFAVAGLMGCDDGTSTPQQCLFYLTCAANVAPSTFGTELSVYGDNGTCWTRSEREQDLCILACQEGVRQLKSLQEGCWEPVTP